MWQNLGSRAGFNGFWLHFGAGETPCTSYKNYKLLIIYKYYFNVIKKKLKFLIYCQVCHKTKYKVTKKTKKNWFPCSNSKTIKKKKEQKKLCESSSPIPFPFVFFFSFYFVLLFLSETLQKSHLFQRWN